MCIIVGTTSLLKETVFCAYIVYLPYFITKKKESEKKTALVEKNPPIWVQIHTFKRAVLETMNLMKMRPGVVVTNIQRNLAVGNFFSCPVF